MGSRTLLLAACVAALSFEPTASASDVTPGRDEWVWPPWARKPTRRDVVYPEISVSAGSLQDLLKDSTVCVLDVRPPKDVRSGHVPGALAWPSAAVDASRVAAAPSAAPALADVDVTAMGAQAPTLVVVADAAALDLAAWAVWRLTCGGHDRALMLDGGMSAWIRAGGALERGAAASAPSKGPGVGENCGFATTIDSLRAHYARPGFEVLDARGDASWRGDAAAGTSVSTDSTGQPARAGHIPHALPFDAAGLTNADGTLLEPRELRSRLAELGPRPGTYVDLEDEFLIYDGGDQRQAALAWLQLRAAGVSRARVVVGGWDEWARDLGNPLVRIVDTQEVLRLLSAEPAAVADDRPPASFLLLDVRNDDEHALGHLPGAVSLPSHRFEAELDSLIASQWPHAPRRETPVVLYCYGETCIRSRICASMAARRGFCDLRWYRAGVDQWVAAGLRLRRAGSRDAHDP